MDSFVNESDFGLLARDRYTFSVLDRILRGNCDLVLTDHRSLILCHSEPPYPVWIWTPDRCPEDAMARAWELACRYRPLQSGYRFNMKYELAEYFMEKAGQDGLDAGIHMNLFAYDCPDPVRPEYPAERTLHCCTPEDEEEAARLIFSFFRDIGEEQPSAERCMEKARAYIDGRAFFFWKGEAGTTVSCCSFHCNQGLATLGCVYTLPECRRRHFAQHLVYRVTRIVKDLGCICPCSIPMRIMPRPTPAMKRSDMCCAAGCVPWRRPGRACRRLPVPVLASECGILRRKAGKRGPLKNKSVVPDRDGPKLDKGAGRREIRKELPGTADRYGTDI